MCSSYKEYIDIPHIYDEVKYVSYLNAMELFDVHIFVLQFIVT